MPQGSVIGPVLYNIFANSFLRALPVDCCVAYTDDITLLVHGSSHVDVCSTIQDLLSIISNWSTDHGMTFSPHKCFTMHVSPKCRDKATVAPPLHLNGTLLPVVTTMRILGVKFMNDLSWEAHSNMVRKKMATMIGTLHRFGHTLNTDCHKKIALVFILPHLQYCLPEWGNTSAGVQSQLDHTLLRAARVISKDR